MKFSHTNQQKSSSKVDYTTTSRLHNNNDSFNEYFQNLAETGRRIRKADKLLQEPDAKEMEKFHEYLRKSGKEYLKLQKLRDFEDKELVKFIQTQLREKNKKSRNEAFNRLGKLIKVDDLEDDGLAILIENEWNTRFWSVEMIISATEGLLSIFKESSIESSLEKKEKALVMLNTLMNRHRVANTYVQERLEIMIGNMTNRIVKYGKSIGSIDYIHVLHRFREKFVADLSKHNLCGKVIEFMMLELQLAAIFIQNIYRMKLRNSSNECTKIIDGFMSPHELRELRNQSTQRRISDLKYQWGNIRASLSVSGKSTFPGLRGPAYVSSMHVYLMLESILTCVSSTEPKQAHTNREIIIRLSGEIILSSFIAVPSGLFAINSMSILMNLSYLPEAYYPLINIDIVSSCYKYFHYYYNEYKEIILKESFSSSRGTKSKEGISEADLKNEEMRLRTILESVIILITNLASHQSRLDEYTVPNNRMNDHKLEKDRQVNTKTNLKPDLHIASKLPLLLKEIVEFSMKILHKSTLRLILMCYLWFASCPCQEIMLHAILTNASRLLQYIVELFEEPDTEISTVAFSLLLQCCNNYPNRHRLMQHIKRFLQPLMVNTIHNNRKPYQRAIYLAIALCRQDLWEYRDPLIMMNSFTDGESMYQALCRDIIKSIKPTKFAIQQQSSQVFNSVHESRRNRRESLSTLPTKSSYYSDLSVSRASNHPFGTDKDHQETKLKLIQPTDNSSTLLDIITYDSTPLKEYLYFDNDLNKSMELSRTALIVGSKGIIDFFSHPLDELYCHSLSIEQLCCHCTIIHVLTMNSATAYDMISYGTLYFLMKSLRICQYQFNGKIVEDNEAILLLKTVISSCHAMSQFCVISHQKQSNIQDWIKIISYCNDMNEMAHSDDTMIRSDLMEATGYFLQTLTMFNKSLISHNQQLNAIRMELLFSILQFYDSYAGMIVSLLYSINVNDVSIVSDWEQLQQTYELSEDKETYSKAVHLFETSIKYINQAGIGLSKALKYLKVSFGALDDYNRLLSKLCDVLTKLTVQHAGVIRAYSEWNVIQSLQVHLPPPVMESHIPNINPTLLSPSHRNRTGSQIMSPKKIDVKKSRKASTIERSSIIEGNDLKQLSADQLNIHKLPITLFQLCLNFTQLDEGKAHSISDGFLRRALEKLILLKPSLQSMDSLTYIDEGNKVEYDRAIPPFYTKRGIFPNKNQSRFEGTILLKYINCMCHYHHPMHGNANDIIFSLQYKLLLSCQEILVDNLSIDISQLILDQPMLQSITNRFSKSSFHRYREDEFIIQIIRTLSSLSEDIITFSHYCEHNNLCPVIYHELHYGDQYPMIAVEYYIKVITNLAKAPKTPYYGLWLDRFRIPLLKLNQIYPDLEEIIRQCHWTISDLYIGSGMSYRTMKIRQSEVIDKALDASANNIPVSDINDSNNINSEKIIQPDNTIHSHSDCGISSCGTLRFHNQSSSLVSTDRDMKSCGNIPEFVQGILPSIKAPSYDYPTGECELSRLPARDKKLQNMIEYRKYVYGYSEKPKDLFSVDPVVTGTNSIRIFKDNAKYTERKKQNALNIIKRDKIVRKEAEVDHTIPIITLDDIPELARTRPSAIKHKT